MEVMIVVVAGLVVMMKMVMVVVVVAGRWSGGMWRRVKVSGSLA